MDPDFLALWDRIKHRTRYRVEFGTDDLVARAKHLLSAEPSVTAAKASDHDRYYKFAHEGLDTVRTRSGEADAGNRGAVLVPDLLGDLQRSLEFKRSTLARILIGNRTSPTQLTLGSHLARRSDEATQFHHPYVTAGVLHQINGV